MTDIHTESRPFRIILLAALALVTGAAGSSGLEAQITGPDSTMVRSLRISTTLSSGWLGVQIGRVVETVDDERTTAEWRIERVVPDSPAAEAGVRDGDVLLSVDGSAPSDEVLTELTTELEPGDEVVLRVRRQGREMAIEIVAGERPAMILERPQGGMLTLRADSTLFRLRDAFDSLEAREWRLALPDTVQRLRGVFLPDSIPGFRGVLRVDSLPGFHGMLRADSAGLRAWSFRFPDTLEMRQWAFPDSQWVVADSMRLRQWRMAVPEAGFPLRFMDPREYDEGSWVFASGRNVVGGAELTPVNEGLAPYFGVRQGLLVVNVVEESPVARAGLRAGDVLVRIDGDEVSTVNAARTALDRAYRSPPVPIEIVRDRRSMTLEITR